MSGSREPVANGHIAETAKTEPTVEAGESTTPQPSQPPTKRPPRRKGPNYAQIHSKPLPLNIHPLPAFHPTHPISLLRLAYAFLSQLISPPNSHPEHLYVGYFSPESRSVHVTDPAQVRALWEMGFFGKGTLSRSEPSWLDREQTKLKAGGGGRSTAEEATRKRREERRLFKLERARLEAEKIEHQRAVEEGRALPRSENVEGEQAADADVVNDGDAVSQEAADVTARAAELNAETQGRVPDAEGSTTSSLTEHSLALQRTTPSPAWSLETNLTKRQPPSQRPKHLNKPSKPACHSLPTSTSPSCHGTSRSATKITQPSAP